MSDQVAHQHVHRDDVGSKLGIWLFIFTELLFFGGLFVVYSVYRYQNATAFALASGELDVTIGTINTVILLVSSMTIAMATTAIQKKNKRLTLFLIGITIVLALAFLVNKYFEWSGKISHGIFPGSSFLDELGRGDVMFFGLYYFMTGLHAFHIIVGVVILGFVFQFVRKGRLSHDNFQLLENGGLYWHLVDLIWIFLFPLFYLIV